MAKRYPAKRVAQARKKIQKLVDKGYRLNPNTASDAYHNAVIGSKKTSRREKQRSATAQAGSKRANKSGRYR